MEKNKIQMNAHFFFSTILNVIEMHQAISEIVCEFCVDFGRFALNFKCRLSLDDFQQCFSCCFSSFSFYCVCEK